MAEWRYFDYMQNYNPVCVDAGNITKIIPNIPKAPYSYHHIEAVIADGVYFGCDTKSVIFKTGGFVAFEPSDYPYDEDAPTIFKKFPLNLSHGDRVDMGPRIRYLAKDNSGYNPICCDPRVLYIMHRSLELPRSNTTIEQFNELFKAIPSRQEALDYLNRNNLMCHPIPFDDILAIIQREE